MAATTWANVQISEVDEMESIAKSLDKLKTEIEVPPPVVVSPEV